MNDEDVEQQGWFRNIIGHATCWYANRQAKEIRRLSATVQALRHERNAGIWAVRVERNKELAKDVVASKIKAITEENDVLSVELGRVRREVNDCRVRFERDRKKLNSEIDRLSDLMLHGERKT
jgi:hypothetical protein